MKNKLDDLIERTVNKTKLERIKVKWQKNLDRFFVFKEDNINKIESDVNGVYIIFSGTKFDKDKVIYVGSGDIKSRLLKHTSNKSITKFTNLHYTYAKIKRIKCKMLRHI